jgi:hypothetical protein
LGVAGAGAVGLSGRGRFGAVGGADAAAPLVAGAIGAAIAVDWALREFDVLSSDAPAEGLTPDTLKQQVYRTAKTRKSTNASTIVNNQNILDGVKNTAYTEAKVAAIESLNDGASQSDVEAAAQNEIDAYLVTVEKNLLKTWNESINEFYTMLETVRSQPDVSETDAFGSNSSNSNLSYESFSSKTTNSRTLVDGTNFDVFGLAVTVNDPDYSPKTYSQDPFEKTNDPTGQFSSPDVIAKNPAGGNITYLNAEVWSNIHDEVVSVYNSVSSGITTWVNNVYGQVQSGQIEISDLLTPRERASIMANEEGSSQAVSDLIALNVPVDLENEATVTIPSTGLTLRGSFGLTDESDGPLEVGTQYDPSTFSGDVYFTTDLSLLEGDWTAFQTGIDGGTITITQEPYQGTILSVTTAADETVDVPATEWTDNGDGTWSYDASGELENAITEVASVSYYSEAESTQYETLNLTNPFTIESFENTETGEQTQQASFTSTEPQTDSNYITQEEWDQLEQQNQELIEKYEESQNTGGAGGGLFGDSSPDIGVIAAALGAIGVLYALATGGES